MKENKETRADRYNKDKIRMDLIPPFVIDQYAKVMSKGAVKYSERNWEKGMPWNEVIASAMRHFFAFMNGEDFDKETGLLHVSHAMWNMAALVEYYRTHPEYDNRPKASLSMPRIALDIDEVLADWVGHWSNKFGMSEKPAYWNFDKDIKAKFEMLKDDKNFWLSIPPLVDPKGLPFEPVGYVTSRNIPQEWTEEWLQLNGFPSTPVITVGHNESKVEAIKSLNAERFVDDRYENWVEINKAGIPCYLMTQPHNSRYDVGSLRINSLSDIITGNHLSVFVGNS